MAKETASPQLTAAAAARVAGCSVSAVRKATEAGAIARTADGHVDRASLAAWIQCRAGVSDVRTQTALERLRLLTVKADRETHEFAIARGEYIEAARVTEIWTGAIAGHRAGLLALHAVVAQRHPEAPPAVVETIRAEARRLLTDLAGSVSRFDKPRRNTRKK